MKHPHWSYFVSLCDDIERVARYVDLSIDNFNTYSIELLRIMFAASSEIDAVAKVLCTTLEPKSKADTIGAYRSILCQHFPGITKVETSLPQHGLSFVPWEEWESKNSPNWWQAYNDVKHSRDKYFAKATLQNMLFAVSGLCVFVSYLHKSELMSSGIQPGEGNLFLAPQYRQVSRRFLSRWVYRLPDWSGKL